MRINRRVFDRLMPVLVFWVAAAAVRAADPPGLMFRLETRVSGAGVETRDASRVYWFDGRWKEDAEAAAVIIDLRDDRLVLLDHENKTWCGGPVDATLAEMEREIGRLAGLVRETYGPPAEPPGVAAAPPQARLEAAGMDDVQGRPAKRFKLWIDRELAGEYWIDPAVRPGDYFPAERLQAVVRRFGAATDLFEKELRSAARNARETAIQDALATLFLQGLEVQSVDYAGGRTVGGKKVLDIRPWHGDPAVFQVPPEYRRISYREFLESTLPTGKEVLDNSR